MHCRPVRIRDARAKREITMTLRRQPPERCGVSGTRAVDIHPFCGWGAAARKDAGAVSGLISHLLRIEPPLRNDHGPAYIVLRRCRAVRNFMKSLQGGKVRSMPPGGLSNHAEQAIALYPNLAEDGGSRIWITRPAIASNTSGRFAPSPSRTNWRGDWHSSWSPRLFTTVWEWLQNTRAA